MASTCTFYPPLLRVWDSEEFVGIREMLGEAQRDLRSEQAAARLQDLDGTTHYTGLRLNEDFYTYDRTKRQPRSLEK